jgi:hypothetical protein
MSAGELFRKDFLPDEGRITLAHPVIIYTG